MIMRMKRANLIKEDGKYYFLIKSYKERNTECRYCIDENTLEIGGEKVTKFPKFKNIVVFENWCFRYIAEKL